MPKIALHALGAAIPVAVDVACALQKRFNVTVEVTTSTETVLDEKESTFSAAEDLEDDDGEDPGAAAAGLPDDSHPTMNTRQVSAIHIVVTRGALPSPL